MPSMTKDFTVNAPPRARCVYQFKTTPWIAALRSESVKRCGAMLRASDGGESSRNGGGAQQSRRFKMLSVPTMWLVFVVNFTALGLIWTYVARGYPNFSAAP